MKKQKSITSSLNWKHQSRQLLFDAKTEQEFVGAAIWCGKEAHALRGIPQSVQQSVTKWLWANKDAILSGTFVLTPSASEELSVKSWPKSWISKICHIMNPHAYPLIHDSQIMKSLSCSTFAKWQAELVNYRSQVASMTDDDIYEMESTLWAKA